MLKSLLLLHSFAFLIVLPFIKMQYQQDKKQKKKIEIPLL